MLPDKVTEQDIYTALESYFQYTGMYMDVDQFSLVILSRALAKYQYTYQTWVAEGKPLTEEFDNGAQVMIKESSLSKMLDKAGRDCLAIMKDLSITPQGRRNLMSEETLNKALKMKKIESLGSRVDTEQVRFLDLSDKEKEMVKGDKDSLIQSLTAGKKPRFHSDSNYIQNIFSKGEPIHFNDFVKLAGESEEATELANKYLHGEMLFDGVTEIKFFEETAVEFNGQIVDLEYSRANRIALDS